MAKKTKKIKVRVFADLRQALADAEAYERSEGVDLRVMELVKPPKEMKPREIRQIRESLHASQPLFADFLCVSPKAVQSWEQGTRKPQSSALRLLEIARKNPSVLLPERTTVRRRHARKSTRDVVAVE
jgi:putative transcriptional regulator